MLSELIYHILNEDTQKVSESLENVKGKGLDVNSHPDMYLYPIDYAAKKGNMEIMKLLMDPVKGGAQINAIGSQTPSPLTHAAMEGNHEIVKFLLEQGADSKQSVNGFSALEMASRCGDIKCVNEILKHMGLIDRQLIEKSIYHCVLRGYLNFIEDASFTTCDDGDLHITPHEGVISRALNPSTTIQFNTNLIDKIKESSGNLFYTREYISRYKNNGFKCFMEHDYHLIELNSENNFKIIVQDKFYEVINRLVEELNQ